MTLSSSSSQTTVTSTSTLSAASRITTTTTTSSTTASQTKSVSSPEASSSQYSTFSTTSSYSSTPEASSSNIQLCQRDGRARLPISSSPQTTILSSIVSPSVTFYPVLALAVFSALLFVVHRRSVPMKNERQNGRIRRE